MISYLLLDNENEGPNFDSKSPGGRVISASLIMTIYGGFFRKFLVYDNLEKCDKLKNVGITIKVPGYGEHFREFYT